MKPLFFGFIGLLLISNTEAQIKEGTIIYERKIDIHRRLQDEQMKAMIPQFRTSQHQLIFSDSTSIYKIVPDDEAPDPFNNGGGGARIIMRFGGGDGGELYKNFATLQSVEASELGAKTYIITDSIRRQNWKLTNETKTIAGHTCHKATTTQKQLMGGGIRININGNSKSDTAKPGAPQEKEIDIVAWYADDIITPVGPENFGGLPGLIVELNSNNGEIVYTTKEIKTSFNKKELKEPTKGKKITRDEFRKIAQEMMGNQGGPGGFIRRG